MPLTTQDNVMQNQIYVPLKVAAKKHNVKENVLTRLIAAGMIETREEAGETLVAVDKNGNGSKAQTKEEIIAAKFAELQGLPISASEASRKYSEIYGVQLSQVQFSRWAKSGIIEVLDRGYKIELNEADVAYCACVFAQKYRQYNGQLRGVSPADGDYGPQTGSRLAAPL